MSTVEGVRAWQFQPALPMRGVTTMLDESRLSVSFQPALPMRGVTWTRAWRTAAAYFNPHSPCGE